MVAAEPAPIIQPGLGRKAARGFLITAAFALGVEVTKLFGGLATARFLRPQDYALAFAAIFAMGLGIQAMDWRVPDRLVQVEADPGDTYDSGFTIMCWLALLYVVFVLVAAPIVARVYGEGILVPICLVVAVQGILLPASVGRVYLQRHLHWWRQRVTTSAGPLVGLVLTLVLAIAGAGVWALVYGLLATVVVEALINWLLAPRRPRLRLRIPREHIRFFLAFGWPIWVLGIVQLVGFNILVFEIQLVLGLATLGLFRLTVSLGDRIDTAELIVAQVLFPVLSRARTEDRLRRAFSLSSRLVLLWAVPAGFGLAIFAQDIVQFLIGPQWSQIVLLLRVEGVGEVVNAIGTTWNIFYLAAGDNRPVLWLGLLTNVLLIVAVGALAPFFGYTGFAGAIGLTVVLGLVVRRHFIRRLLPGVPVLTLAIPSVSAGLIAGACTLALDWQLGAPTWPGLVLRVAVFLGVYLAICLGLQRQLVGEGLMLLRQRELPA